MFMTYCDIYSVRGIGYDFFGVLMSNWLIDWLIESTMYIFLTSSEHYSSYIHCKSNIEMREWLGQSG
jgi:hypothetical protein